MLSSAPRRARASAIVERLLVEYGTAHRAEDLAAVREGLSFDDGAEYFGGVSEFALSLRSDLPPRVRCMAEIVRRRTLDASTAALGREWGSALLRRIERGAARAYSAALFDAVYRLVYEGACAGTGPYRFGLALEFAGAAPVVKAYFDLHAIAAEHRPAIITALDGELDGMLGTGTWLAACPALAIAGARVLGVDFGAERRVRAKLYRGANALEWSGVERLLEEVTGASSLDRETLECLRREVCGPDAPLAAVLVGVASEARQRSLKLDVSLPGLYASDRQALDAVARFCRTRPDKPGSSVELDAPFRIVGGPADPSRSRRILPYFGVELRQGSSPRVSLYFRPPGFETEHMSAAVRPVVLEAAS